MEAPTGELLLKRTTQHGDKTEIRFIPGTPEGSFTFVIGLSQFPCISWSEALDMFYTFDAEKT